MEINPAEKTGHKAGYVTIVGLPNAGKSTLMNALLGQKLSITSKKPQTTRKKIAGILSEEQYQIIFLDTPGILEPQYLLQEKMNKFIEYSASDADVLLFIFDAQGIKSLKRLFDENFTGLLEKYKRKKKILLLNKIDLVKEESVKQGIEQISKSYSFDEIIPVSALLGLGTEHIIERIVSYMPVHPKFFDDDRIAEETERFFVSEIIREKIFEIYSEEIPYSTEVVIEEFKERENTKDFISATILVERESQKPIIIGKQGAAIKKLGEAARSDIESFHGKPVFLELRVKVQENWRSDSSMLKKFGYEQ